MPRLPALVLSGLLLSCPGILLAQFPFTAQSRAALTPTDLQIANPLTDSGRAIAAVAAHANRSVVHIESTIEGRRGDVEETGSGVIVTSPRTMQPFIVTNRHVIADAPLSSISILLSDGRVIKPREKLEDPESDVAVLKIDDPGIPAAEFGDSDNLDIGHFVLALGSPFGLSQSVTLGIISAKGRRSLELPGKRKVINQDFLQTDAAINPGNSGGPLVDMQGRVIGINTAIASQGGGNEGIGFSIPSNLVRFISEQLVEQGRVRRGYLGVVLDEEFDDETARNHSLPRLTGARIITVTEGTPAAKAGLQPDDIVLNFDGVDIEDHFDLINKVSLTPINKSVRLVVLRTGKQVVLQIILTERPQLRSDITPNVLPLEPMPYRNSSLQLLKLNDGLALQSGYLASQSGLLVTAIPSGETSLRLYDVVIEAARQPVNSVEDFNAASDLGKGPILLKVRRIEQGQVREFLATWEP